MADDGLSFRSSLSVQTTMSSRQDDDENDEERIPLRTQILEVVKNCPNQTIRPAKLSQELGLSIADASASFVAYFKFVNQGHHFILKLLIMSKQWYLYSQLISNNKL